MHSISNFINTNIITSWFHGLPVVWLAGWLVGYNHKLGEVIIEKIIMKDTQTCFKVSLFEVHALFRLETSKPFSIPQNFLQFSGPTSILHKLCERNF